MSWGRYGDRTPGVVVTTKMKAFTCAWCGEPGYGAINAKVHQNGCKRLYQNANNLKASRLRQQKRKLKESRSARGAWIETA